MKVGTTRVWISEKAKRPEILDIEEFQRRRQVIKVFHAVSRL